MIVSLHISYDQLKNMDQPFDIDATYQRLKGNGKISGAVILSTCNRFEIYLSTDMDAQEVMALFPERDFLLRTGWDSVEHLFRVSAGLDSKIVGENEIQGQIRDAFNDATDRLCVDRELMELFRNALRVGKRIRKYASGTVRKELQEYIAETVMHYLSSNAKTVIIGAGKVGSMVAVALRNRGFTDITICSRSEKHMMNLAREISADTLPAEKLRDGINRYALIITATSAKVPILSLSELDAEVTKLVVDLSIEKNVLADTDRIRLVTLDDLYRQSYAESDGNMAYVLNAMEIINRELREMKFIYERKRSEEIISDYYRESEQYLMEEIYELERKVALTDEQKRYVMAMARSLAGRILDRPTRIIRDLTGNRSGREAVEKAKGEDEDGLSNGKNETVEER